MASTVRLSDKPSVWLLRGLVRACPRCGNRKGLFTSWFRMRPDCPRCGTCFEREEGFFLGAYTINLGFTMVAFAIYLVAAIVLTWPDPPAVPLAVGGVITMVVVILVGYPISKTTWAAFDLMLQRMDRP